MRLTAKDVRGSVESLTSCSMEEERNTERVILQGDPSFDASSARSSASTDILTSMNRVSSVISSADSGGGGGRFS